MNRQLFYLFIFFHAGITFAQSPTPSPSPTASPMPTQTGTTNNCISERQDCEQQAVGSNINEWIEEAEDLLAPMDDDCGRQPNTEATFCERMEYAICIIDGYNSATLANIFSHASDLQNCEIDCRGCMNRAGGNVNDCSLSTASIVDSVLEIYDNLETAEVELPALADGCDWEQGEIEENTDCSTLSERPEPSHPLPIRYYDEPLEYTCEIGDLAFTETLSLGAVTVSQLETGYLYSSTCSLECACVWQQSPSATCASSSEACPSCPPLALGATRLDDVPVVSIGLFGDPRAPADRLESACRSVTAPPCDSLCATSLTNYQTNNPPVTHTTDCTTWERITPSPSPSPSPQSSASPTPSSTPTPTPSPFESPVESPTPEPTPEATPSPLESTTATPTPQPTPSVTDSPVQTPTPVPNTTLSPTPSATTSPLPEGL